jgi:hypothetical protein
MKGLKSSSFFVILSLVTVLMIANAHGQMSQQEAMNYVQQYREAGVITDIYVQILENRERIKVTVGPYFHEKTPGEKYDFARLLSLSYPWEIIAVTDATTDQEVFNILGCPVRQ